MRFLTIFLLTLAASAQDTKYPPDGQQIPGPGSKEATTDWLSEITADGVNGDTYNGVPRSFRMASDATGHPLAFEPEGYPDSDEMLDWDNLTWGYWKYPFIPSISRGKWLEPRHMVHVCDRWNKDKTNNLQFAFFNGVGYESWENVWGIWNGITPRDAEALRRIAKIERRFADYLVSPAWEPHTPTVQYGVFASRWPLANRTLWTIVNRTAFNIQGPQLQVPVQPGMRYFDLWNGKELKPENGSLSFPIEAFGFAAILAQREAADAAGSAFLAEMAQLSAKPLSSFSKAWEFLPQLPVRIPATAPATGTPPG